MDFLCYFIIPFTVLVLYQIRTGANNMCHRFDIFLAKPAKWSFTSLVNTILHWISSNSFFCCSTNKTFRLPFQLSFPQPHFFLRSLWHYVYLTNCSYNAFSFHSFSWFSFFSFLLILTMYFSKLSSVAVVLTRVFPMNGVSWMSHLQIYIGFPTLTVFDDCLLFEKLVFCTA